MLTIAGRIHISILVAALLVLLACSAYAQAFNSVWDFEGTGVDNGRTYLAIDSSFQYKHDLADIWQPGVAFDAAKFDVTYKMISSTSGQIWYVEGAGDGENTWWLLGNLKSAGSPGSWQTDTFDVPTEALDFMSSSGYLVIKLRESPDTCPDLLWLDQTRLYGQLAQPQSECIPEAGSLMLAAVGLAPVAAFYRRRK